MSEAHIEPTDELAQFLGDLEASEINGEITLSWMYDRLWTVRIGGLGNYHAEDNFKSLGEAMNWLRDKVIAPPRLRIRSRRLIRSPRRRGRGGFAAR